MKQTSKPTKRAISHPQPESPKTFLEHLNELKNRFFVWLLFLILFSVLGYFVYPSVLSLLVKPLDQPLYYSSPVGAFEVVFNTSLFFGFITSLPVLLYQILKFLSPSFGKKIPYSIFLLIILSLLLASLGIVICYLLILPPSLKFLSQFERQELTALISTNDYFSFVFKYLGSFAVIFQMPLVMYAANKIHKLKVKNLLINFRYVFLASFVTAGFLTPTPDMINQTIMATPILTMYLISVLIIWISNNYQYIKRTINMLH